MHTHSSLFTNGKWKKGAGPLFTSQNPASGEIIWEGSSASANDVQESISYARHAFEDWSKLPMETRASYLKKFGSILEKQLDSLSLTISKETGKPLWESKGEVNSMIKKIEISLEAYNERCPEKHTHLPQADSFIRHKPHGVLAVFGPYNFPGHLPNGHIIPALLAGNTVIFKPSELTPLVAEEIIKSWEAANLPPGVISLLQGGPETGKALIADPGMNGLLFTGSFRTGQLIAEAFASQPQKILALEMGGNNPFIIGTIQDFKAAAYLTIQSAYLTSGQRCTCARRLIVPKGHTGDQFLGTLVEMIKKIKVGPYTDQPEPFMGPLISERVALALLEAQNSLLKKGGLSLIEMHSLQQGTGLLTPGLMDVTSIREREDEEIFGPFLQVIRVSDFDEALEEANHTRYGLAAGLLSDHPDEYAKFYNTVQAGIMNWNTQLTGASSAAPFGGIGCSGNHRPSAYYAADYCAYPVSSLENAKLSMPKTLSPGFTLD